MNVNPQQTEQRIIPARIFTSAGWVVGTFHVGEKLSFDFFLDMDEPYFKLTNVTLPNGPMTLDFFALRRDAAIVVVPQGDPAELQLQPATRAIDTHDVACLLETGILLGKLDLLPNIRVSDYLGHRRGFAPLRDCEWVSGTPRVEAPLVFVNSPRVIGVTERDRPADSSDDLTP